MFVIYIGASRWRTHYFKLGRILPRNRYFMPFRLQFKINIWKLSVRSVLYQYWKINSYNSNVNLQLKLLDKEARKFSNYKTFITYYSFSFPSVFYMQSDIFRSHNVDITLFNASQDERCQRNIPDLLSWRNRQHNIRCEEFP